MRDLRDYRAFILDLDGVIYRGEQLLPGAREFISWADATGRRLIFLSNNSFASPDEVTAKLAHLGAPHPEGRVLTSGAAAARQIAARHTGGSVFVLGVASVERMVEAEGLRAVWREGMDGPPPDALLVGLDFNLSYDRLRRGLRAILAGADFIAVNRDPSLPVEDGLNPGTGSIVAALEYASGRTAEIIGKPAPGMMLEALREMGAEASETLVVGDGLELDIVAGHAAGMDAALVLTGMSTRAQVEAATGPSKPDLIFDSIGDLLAALQEQA
jgi:HAD superfamily hydrolase (TIGR01450 family)